MDKPDTTLNIRALGRFSISVDGIPVAADWPNETMKVFFCSLLSPLDLYFTWDRICRSMWDFPETEASRQRLEELIIGPLGSFLIKELGFNPLLSGPEGIRIDRQRMHIDAHDFYRTALEGLRMYSLALHPGALKKLIRANELYTGGYLPGIPGKIIASTRNELESLYRTAVIAAIPHTHSYGSSDGTKAVALRTA